MHNNINNKKLVFKLTIGQDEHLAKNWKGKKLYYYI